jgi:hypothetical protein
VLPAADLDLLGESGHLTLLQLAALIPAALAAAALALVDAVTEGLHGVGKLELQLFDAVHSWGAQHGRQRRDLGRDALEQWLTGLRRLERGGEVAHTLLARE